MNRILSRHELQKGDVLMSLGKGWLSELINHLNGGRYSHASLYDGECVIECVAAGVQRNTLEDLFEHRVFADVFRFRTDSGIPLNEARWPADPVIDVGRHYLDLGTRYAYHQLLMMGLLMTSRRTPIPSSWRPLVRTHIDQAVKLLADLMDKGVEPLTCSEFIYRCFYEAEPVHQYGLTVPGVLESKHFQDAVRLPETAPQFEMQAAASMDDDAAIDLLTSAFAKRYASLKPRLSGGLDDGDDDGFELQQANANVVSDFVSPGDLERSPNFIRIGELRL